MKFNIKTMMIISGFLGMSGLFASTAAPVDPDFAVYSAICTIVLGSAPSSAGGVSQLSSPYTLPSGIGVAALKNSTDPLLVGASTGSTVGLLGVGGALATGGLLANALTYYGGSADGKTPPTTTASTSGTTVSLITYYNNVYILMNAVSTFQTTLQGAVGAETDLHAATAATTPSALAALFTTNIQNQASWLATNSSIGTIAADIKAIYDNIISFYTATSSQTAANLPAYLTSLNALFAVVQNPKVIPLFGAASSTQNVAIGTMAAIVNALTANPAALTTLPTATVSSVNAYITNTGYAAEVKAWRTFLNTPAPAK